MLRSNIYVYESNFNRVQFIQKAHYRDINGIFLLLLFIHLFKNI